jgi:hypothetical protein
MKILRREIHPHVRVLDEKAGLVEYVASDETLDSYREIIRADCWKFDDFQKNSPFVDSHNYGSIDFLLGRVVDFAVRKKELVETVKWAIDVPTNLLAQKGFQMTAAGYLKAVSVGFVPVATVTPYDRDKSGWLANCEELHLDPNQTECQCIYTEAQQKELSACIVGANPNAVAQIEKAYQAGILNDSDLQQFSRMSPDFSRAFEQRKHRPRAYSFASSPQPDAVSAMVKALGGTPSPTNPQPQPSPMQSTISSTDFSRLSGASKRAFENLEFARRAGNETEIERAVLRVSASLERERNSAYGNPIERYLEAKPERRFFWNGVIRKIGGCLKVKSLEYEAVQRAVSGVNLQDQFGAGMLLAVPVGDELYDLLLHYGAYKYLGLRKLIGAYTRFAEVTAFPNAVFITPSMQGNTTIPDDTAYAGTAVTPDANTIATIIKASLAWLQDQKVDYSNVIVSKIVMAVAARIDWGCFSGTGQDDVKNGMTVGIFNNPNVKVFQTAVAKSQIAALERTDFINTIALVNVAALQRMDEQPPRWYISPVFIPQLLLLKDGVGPQYLLKSPAETGGDWRLVGFPVTWAAQAPTATVAGSNVAAFGNPDAYLVALQEKFELTRADSGAEFADASIRFRAVGRGQSMMRDVGGFALLQLGG